MEDFKRLPKMKAGGSCAKPKAMCYGGKMKKGGEVDSTDIKQDKAIIKKAFKMHDEQEHKGERTNLSKLCGGGRAKKSMGSVRKYKTGGTVTNVYEAKKDAGDKDNIQKTKDIKAGVAAAPSKATVKGKEIKKFQAGRSTGPLTDTARKLIDMENMRQLGRIAQGRKYLGPAQQSQAVSQGVFNPLTSASTSTTPVSTPMTTTPMGDQTGIMGQKRGGKVKCK